MAKNKSPGPDGFTPEFFVHAWSIVGQDVCIAFASFFENSKLPKFVNSTDIALIPEQQNASHLSHFRPISCCNALYKCLSKLLADRLKNVLNGIISPYQTAFVPHRTIGDNILLAQSLCRDYYSFTCPPKCAIKLDLHKAFDSINWGFILLVLRAMGIPSCFVSWIEKCITTCMFSIKVNGVLEGFFACAKGIRQGDPLSPYLFVLAMEVLTACIKKSTSEGMFSFHWRTKGAKISHLIFADDVVLFCRGDRDSIDAIYRGITLFSSLSGLFPNPRKSQCFFGNIPHDVINFATQLTGFQRAFLPVKYLGLPLFSLKPNAAICASLISPYAK